MYIVRDRETGTRIETVETLEEARKIISQYETEDRENGFYVEDFYEIYDDTKEEIIE